MAAAAALPTFPRLVFTVFEPISLVGGFLGAVINPDWFISEQIVQGAISAAVPTAESDNARLVALQLGNIYLLMAMVGLAVLNLTNELKVVRGYLVALWIADLGHIYVCYHVMGLDRFLDVASWNSMAWGNVGVTALLCLTRTAYLLGLFGKDVPLKNLEKKQQ
ncbi:hypothetical protein CPAR01_10407 [Colletotrichum paranaense]|uniref:DUF7704 domain-containing protein n=3 Tax=Colletotrichum acutatum species complex TaxID=2707335 RepID=A0AAI9XNF0_9PEZI|nr:uncharacterized protein CPAR01_10407 [Colletotrichum paranaense]XP_060379328.1 uncharacterized protein CTAM01_09984 [Colletotrichum tamarilloi]KAI3529254.1 hypothetical protein CSPX01_15638 [Colletotrichum filicis]KAK1454312.1 hypothetical protein CCUS01_10606 [Colletotrichum cuscutae]KAK1710448.1 hypothetical protein BDP67DRAFT_521282 [Colletotrichum lupini]KAK1492190.1 hypothetical protein CTAM01_09984 [Colletotrichum tamarilloi]KAK1533699.1 hypothetical protein CPAR01_10407 [Colletotric